MDVEAPLAVQGEDRCHGREPEPREEKGLPNGRFVVTFKRENFEKSRLVTKIVAMNYTGTLYFQNQ